MIIWHIIFWTSLFLILHSYMLYPWILQVLSAPKKENDILFSDAELPPVTIVMSLFNEERILADKLASILASDYPPGKITVLAGSDASTDRTGQILLEWQQKDPRIQPRIFERRQGKPAVINQLMEEVKNDLVIMTDAKVIFHKKTIRTLIRHFANEEIGIVGGNVLNETVSKNGVSIQEQAFMSREILMKYREGLIWGATVGVYGAIYAIRKELFKKVPEGFAVDDFFISMNVLRKRKKALLDIHAITYLEVPNLLAEEYRRKVRIATGNYMNLRYFAKELLRPWKGGSFAYISHKVIRWLGPFIIMAFLLSNIMLYPTHQFYEYSLLGFVIVVSLPIIDFFLSKIGIHIVFLRFVRHFLTMNIALLHGFINNLGGIRKDVWQPTNR